MNLWNAVIGLLGVILGVAIKYLLDRRTENERTSREDRLRFLDIKRETYAQMGASVLERRFRIATAKEEIEQFRQEVEQATDPEAKASPEVRNRMEALEAQMKELEALVNESGTEARRHMAVLQLVAPQSVIDAAWGLTERARNRDELSRSWSRWVDACRKDLEGA